MCTSFSCCLAPEQYSSFLNLPRSKGELTVPSILTLANTESHEVSSKALSNNSAFHAMSIYGRGYAHKEDGVLSFSSCWINELHWVLNSTNPNHGVYTLRVSFSSVQFSSVTQSCPTLCDPMDCSTPGLPVHHQLPGFIQTHVNWVGDAI